MEYKSPEHNSKPVSESPSVSPNLPAAKESPVPAKQLKKQHQRFCLKWDKYQANLTHVFDQLLQNELFVDVTLACDGRTIKAHRIVLSACSPYFHALFLDNPCQHPTIILRDIEWPELRAAIEFMYKGEVNVFQEQIGPLLRVAEMLKIRGLTEIGDVEVGDELLTDARARDIVDETVSSLMLDNLADIMAIESKKCDVPPKAESDCGAESSSKEAAIDLKSQRGRSWTPPPSMEKRMKTTAAVEDDAVANNFPTPNWIANKEERNAVATAEQRASMPAANVRPASEGPSLGSMNIDDLEIKPEIAEMIREEEKVKYENSYTILYVPSWLGKFYVESSSRNRVNVA